MKIFLRVVPVLMVIISLVVTGCVTPRPVKKPAPEPGLFSGKSGKVIIYSSKTRKRR